MIFASCSWGKCFCKTIGIHISMLCPNKHQENEICHLSPKQADIGDGDKILSNCYLGCYCNLKYRRSFCNNIWTAIEFGISQVGFNSNSPQALGGGKSSMNSLVYYCNPKYCRLGYNNIWITIEFGIL